MAPRKPPFPRDPKSKSTYGHVYANKNSVGPKKAAPIITAAMEQEAWEESALKKELDKYVAEAYAKYDQEFNDAEREEDAAPSLAPNWKETIDNDAGPRELSMILMARDGLPRDAARAAAADLSEDERRTLIAWGKERWRLWRARDTSARGKRRAEVAAETKGQTAWTPSKTARLETAVQGAPSSKT